MDGAGDLRRSFKFLLRPTRRQEAALVAMLDDHRALYNGALEHRRELWRRGRISVGFYDQDAELKQIRAELPAYRRWAFGSERDQLRRLDRAFKAFYRRVRAGQTPGFPRFRGRERFDSITWPQHGYGCKWQPDQSRLYLLGVGEIRVHAHRETRGRIKTVTVKREGRRWYVVLSCDQVPARPLPATGAAAGVDLGVVHFATTSDGEHVANPRHLRRSADRLAAAQVELARKRRGSARRRKARARVAAIYRKVREQRRDFHHKTALALVRRYDLLAVEALQAANMSRRPAPRPNDAGGYDPNGAAAKAGLNRSILDAGWSGFLLVLAGKAEDAGRELVQVPPAFTSQTCAACEHVDRESRISQAAFCCRACGYQANADANAAIVILRAGLARQVPT